MADAGMLAVFVRRHGQVASRTRLATRRRGDRIQAWPAANPFSRSPPSGLTLFAKTDGFAQFSQAQGGDALDLMLVDGSTFEPMWQAAEERDFGGARARIPSLDHLLALKLHTLRQSLPHRTSKDAEDVEILVRRHGLKLRDARWEQLFLKYGSREIYDTFLRLLRD